MKMHPSTEAAKEMKQNTGEAIHLYKTTTQNIFSSPDSVLKLKPFFLPRLVPEDVHWLKEVRYYIGATGVRKKPALPRRWSYTRCVQGC